MTYKILGFFCLAKITT